MSSTLQEALAVFASCSSLHVCAKKKLKDLQKKDSLGIRQPSQLPKHAVEQWVPHYNPEGPSTGCQIVCNVNTTGTYIYIYSLFCSARLISRKRTAVCLAQFKTWSVRLPRKDGIQPKQYSPGWSLAGCATSLLTGQTVAIPSRYNG